MILCVKNLPLAAIKKSSTSCVEFIVVNGFIGYKTIKKMKTTKTQQVKEHLIQHKEISSLDAIKFYSATRLAAIVFNLKKEGFIIETEPKKIRDRNDNPCTYALYKLVSTPKENVLLNKQL